ncbi:MAG: ATP-dependent DNA helicase [Clostridia bacterium]|nr:ATP-dependent DNA helicase [Clostridia bacterium]
MEKNKIHYLVQNIRDNLIEIQCINEKAKAIFKVEQFLLLENYTGNVYKYEAINYFTFEKKYLFYTKKPISESKHLEVAKKILKLCTPVNEQVGQTDNLISKPDAFAKTEETHRILIDDSGTQSELSNKNIESYEVITPTKHIPNESPTNSINKLFKEELPKYNYVIRESQIELSKMMYAALKSNNIALCEAEVGIGKTYAYIIAAIHHQLNNKNLRQIQISYPWNKDFQMATKMPIVISTSSIALQKAVANDYIPGISKMLMDCGLIKMPLSCVIRKGKEHYICDKRLNSYIVSLNAKSNENEKVIEEKSLLNQLTSENFMNIDLDNYQNLSCYIKSKISVSSQCNSKCDLFATCRYNKYLQYAKSANHNFQICNHNYLIADTRHRSKGLSPLIPDYQAIIIDESHKLLDSAKQMYGNCISCNDIPMYLNYIKKMKFKQECITKLIESSSNRLANLNTNLYEELKKPLSEYDLEEDTERYKVVITSQIQKIIKSIIYTLEVIISILKDASNTKSTAKSILKYVLRSMCDLSDQFKVYLDCQNIIYWLEIPRGNIRGFGKTVLCSIPKGLENVLYRDFWSKPIPIILTSGTLSVNGCFSHIKKNIGIDRVGYRLDETSKKSPFNYSENCLLYIPNKMPFPNSKDPKYIKAISDETERLIKATFGHTLILFTSYKVMELVYNQISRRVKHFPIFKMGKGVINTINEFKQSQNGILFASGNCWEGIDIPGDILSSLIIVKLPFSVPDPISEYEQTLYDSTEEYKNKVVFPEMIIKLKQGVGRLIRKEDDTGVISILDSRLKQGSNYRDKILNALPKCRIISSIGDIEKFIRFQKNVEYFKLA